MISSDHDRETPLSHRLANMITQPHIEIGDHIQRFRKGNIFFAEPSMGIDHLPIDNLDSLLMQKGKAAIIFEKIGTVLACANLCAPSTCGSDHFIFFGNSSSHPASIIDVNISLMSSEGARLANLNSILYISV